MKKIIALKIGTKLALGFGGIALLIVGLAALSLVCINTISGLVKTQNQLRIEQLEPLYAAREALGQTGIAARNAYVFTNDKDAGRELDILDQQKALYLDAIVAMSPVFKGNADFDKAKAGLLAMAKELERPRKYREAGKMEEFGHFLVDECAPLRRQIVADIDVVLKDVQQMVDRRSRIAESELEWSINLIMGIAALTLLASLAVGIVLTRHLLRQLGGEPANVVSVARSVARGDLTVDVLIKDGDRSSAMAAMRDMRDSLTAIVTKVHAGAANIATTSTGIASGNRDLSSRTEQQASSLEETASSMEELTSTVRQNAENAQQGNALAVAASQVAVRGGEVMEQVVGTMTSINQSARKIADIIGVIDGIAFQTNILALNAAVEAARAGEQGKGFAVVAAEVRSLAQKSAGAAKEIKSLINDSVARIDEGSKLVSEAGTTMTEIVGSVQRVTTIMSDIVSASREQSAGIEQVNCAIVQIDQATQQNATLVEQAAAAAQALQEQARQLSAEVGIFQLAGRAGASGLDAEAERMPASDQPGPEALGRRQLPLLESA